MTYLFDPIPAENLELSSAKSESTFSYFRGEELANMVWEDELINTSWFEDLRFDGFTRNFDLIEELELRAQLRQMKLRMQIPLLAFGRLKHLLVAHILLLFGLCCAKSSYIFAAFFGSSSTRIFSL